MKPFLIAALAAAAAVAAPGAASAQYSDSQLVGYWECAGSDGGFSALTRVEVAPGGSIRHVTRIEGAPEGSSVSALAVSTGSWAIQGGDIFETISEASLLEIELEGVYLPPSALQESFGEGLVQSGRLPIVELTSDTLVYLDGGFEARCTRLG